jgi:5-methylcytosine-specific restriction protein A
MFQLVTKDLPTEIASRIGDSYSVAGSIGRGRWATTAWIAVFDPLVTTSAQRGYYVVYLFRTDGSGVYLSLNQGTTEVHDAVGREYRSVLTHRAETFAELLSTEPVEELIRGPIDLAGPGFLTKGYEAGSVLARLYTREELPNDSQFDSDLERFISLYNLLTERRDALADDASPTEEAQAGTGVDAQRRRWHLRTERNRSLARKAKQIHGTTCQACGFTYPDRYGEIGEGYIEAHHLIPFADLAGRPTELNPSTDFAVLCANCHRMVHSSVPPLSIDELVGHLV